MTPDLAKRTEFLLAAETQARSVPADTSTFDATQRERASWTMQRAVTAMEEVLKLIPRTDRVPDESLLCIESRALYAQEPGRFRRSRLEAVRAAYRDAVTSLSVQPS